MKQTNLPPFVPGEERPEALYEELAKLSAELKIPVPQMHVSLEARGPDGIVNDVHTQRSRTYVRNFWNYFCVRFGWSGTTSGTYGAGVLSIKDTSGNTQTLNSTQAGGNNYAKADYRSVYPTAADNSQGIVVGTGTGAESFESTTLGTIIANGSGAGQLNYQAMSRQTPSYNSGNLTWTNTVVRVCNNNSGGTIVVTETGIYAQIIYSSQVGIFMVNRDLLGSSVSVLSGGQLTVTYTYTLTFPG